MDKNQQVKTTEEKPMGLAEHLNIIADKLLGITEMEKDPEKKKEYFSVIYAKLMEDAERIEKMIVTMDEEEVSPKVAEICQDVEKNFALSAGCFLDAIDLMVKYLEQEEAPTIVKARDAIKEGTKYLDQADVCNRALSVLQVGPTEEELEAAKKADEAMRAPAQTKGILSALSALAEEEKSMDM